MNDETPTPKIHPQRPRTIVALANSSLAIGISIALVFGVIGWVLVNIARDHRSEAQICATAGGSYSALLHECDVPAPRR